MDEVKDTYKTITKPSEEVLFKDKNSKFFGYAFPVTSEEEAKEHLEELKKKHHAARHWCYAWQLGKAELITGQTMTGSLQTLQACLFTVKSSLLMLQMSLLL